MSKVVLGGSTLLVTLLLALIVSGCGNSNSFVSTSTSNEPTGLLTLRLDLTNPRVDIKAQTGNNTINKVRVTVPGDSGSTPVVEQDFPPNPVIEVRVPLSSKSCRITYANSDNVVLFESWGSYSFGPSDKASVENPHRNRVSSSGQYKDITITQQSDLASPGLDVAFKVTGRNAAGLVDITDLGTLSSSDTDVLEFQDPSNPDVATVKALGRAILSFQFKIEPPAPDLVVAPASGLPVVYRFNQKDAKENENPQMLDSFLPYLPNQATSIRVATGDINGDGNPDLVTAPGSGYSPPVNVDSFSSLRARDGSGLFVIETNNPNGAFVALGDVDGDGDDDIITGSGSGEPPKVKIVDGADNEIGQFTPFEDTFQGGVQVAAGDIDGDNFTDIVVMSGDTASPTVKIFEKDGADFTPIREFGLVGLAQPGELLEPGDYDGDGKPDIGVGYGSGGPSCVELFDPIDGTPQGTIKLQENTNQGAVISPGFNGLFGGVPEGNPLLAVGIFLGDVVSRQIDFFKTISFGDPETQQGVRVASLRKAPNVPTVRATLSVVIDGSTTSGGGTTDAGTGGTTGTTSGGTDGGSGSSGGSGGTGGTPPPTVVFALPAQVFPAEVDSIIEPDVAMDDDFIVVAAQRQTGVSPQAILLRQVQGDLAAAIPSISFFQSSNPVSVAQNATGSTVSTAQCTMDQTKRYSVAWLKDEGTGVDVNVKSYNRAADPVATAGNTEAPFGGGPGEFYASPGLDSSKTASGQFYLGALENTANSVAGGFLTHFSLTPFSEFFDPVSTVTTANNMSEVAVNSGNTMALQIWSTQSGNVKGRLLIGPAPFTLDTTEFNVHALTSGIAQNLSVEFLSDSTFVVVNDFGNPGSRGIVATLFQIGSGSPRVTATRVFVVSGTADSFDPDVAADTSDGTMWVSWTRDTGGGNTIIEAQRYDSDGTSLTPGAIQISGVGDVAGTASNSAVALNDSGGGIIVWQADESVGNPGVKDIFGRVFQRQ